MPADTLLSLRRDLLFELAGSEAVLETREQRWTVWNLSAGFAAALSALASDGAPRDRLLAMAGETEGEAGRAKMTTFLTEASERAMLRQTVLCGGAPLATWVPMPATLRSSPVEPASGARYVLSRFALCRRTGPDLFLESPRSSVRILLHGWRGAALLDSLARPFEAGRLGTGIPGVEPEAAEVLSGLLLGAGMICEVGPDGTTEEEREPDLAHWEFHDLLFHARSRRGRHGDIYGTSLRFLGRFDSLPALKPGGPGELVELAKPEPETLSPLVEGRKSIRSYAEEPLCLRELGEFLYRAARVRRLFEDSKPQQRTDRPHPSGGACYPLEIYPVVRACRDLDPGLYRYRPFEHRLERMSARTPDLDRLIKGAWYATGRTCEPQILFVVTARMRRVSWKYQSVAYALVLKDVGVLMQNMYLAAAAIDLAPCAIGGGDSDLFARASGLDYYAEPSVGEFILGSQAPLSSPQ